MSSHNSPSLVNDHPILPPLSLSLHSISYDEIDIIISSS